MHQFNPYRFLVGIVLVLSSYGWAQFDGAAADASTATTTCAAPSYGCARSDLIKTNNLNPPPNVAAGKNTRVTPSDFKLPILRVTDSTTYANKPMSTTPSGSNGDNIFNVDDSYMIVVDSGAWRYPVALDATNMQVLNKAAWNPGTNQVRWGGSTSFSRVNRAQVYALASAATKISGVVGNDTTMYKLTLSGTTSISATGTKVFDFATCPGMPKPYNIGKGLWHSTMTVSAGDKRFSEAFSNQGPQGTGTDVTVYDAPSGKCYRYDTAHAQLCTSTGCSPMSLPDKFTVHEVYMSLDGKYLRIEFTKCTGGGCWSGKTSNPYFWEIGTNNVTRCYTSLFAANCTGHMVEGYTHIYNWTLWPETAKRTFADPLSYSVINTSPDLTPSNDAHYSNNAADAYDTHPFWVTNAQNVHKAFSGAGCNTTGNIYEGCTFPGPLYGEIFGITQSGNYIRAAHSYNSGSSTDFNCTNTIGAVSQTGKFFAWTSDWLTTLGKDANGHTRCDVFIVKLDAAQWATH